MNYHFARAIDLYRLDSEYNRLNRIEKRKIFNHAVESLMNAQKVLKKFPNDVEALKIKNTCYQITGGEWADEVRSEFLKKDILE
jgi:hypothetical protein